MDGQQIAAALGHGAGRAFDLGSDVVQLPVLKDRLAGSLKFVGEGDPAGPGQQGQPDLVGADRRAETVNHGPGGVE